MSKGIETYEFRQFFREAEREPASLIKIKGKRKEW